MLKPNKLLVASILLAAAPLLYAKPVQVTDILNRKVTVDLPAKRVVLGFYYQDYMAVGGNKALDNVVGFSKKVWSGWAPASWELFSKAVPKLNQLADIGEVEEGTFSVEKVLSLNPDLLVLADWQYKALGSDLDKITKAGIPVVVLDYNAQTLAKHVRSTEILGQLTGQPQRAKQISGEYQKAVQQIQQRVRTAKQPKPKVYAEFGRGGPNDQGVTFYSSMWGSMINLVGAQNIAPSSIGAWGALSAEQVLATKPDTVIITGRETELKKNQEGMVMGFNITPSEAQRRLAGFTKRAGWSALPAVKNQRVFGAYHANSRSMSDVASVQFVAKAAYPELFKDLNPTKTYTDFYRKYLPVVPSGTFYIQLAK
ncbi:ABC transporter substrate-binding protein [Neisseria sp. ZJ106]|uniref:ABC transporter substrate-binding protein n=1 Tax=Neisseria lisongii TaxID=2912188 RepID=A0ABY7RM93_9NEIS|nr:ABC transporter substrate-binding protein [Neisseria lisongii]MCF7521712.1 ABC transporter substrate-binding protein [Neisseria lisongii]WCL72205.1 ABC transporter substrate-binding protein [Neisseria lisongii]